jgi:hemolysin III
MTPRLRGAIHQHAFFVSVVAGALLIASAAGVAGHVAASVFALGTVVMFGASALYHRVRWSPRGRRWMRRIDHAGIYLMIAASYTPYGLLVLDGAWRIGILTVVWAGVAAGIILRFAWFEAPGWLSATIAVVLGWVSVIAVPKAFDTLGPTGLALLLTGGVLYTAGALVYALRRPNPFPHVFGFHEVFHALVVVAVACQYAVVAFVVLPTA